MFLLTARIRFMPLLKLVKLLNLAPGGFRLAGLFDPNAIRKNISFRFKEKLVPLKCYGGTFVVDVNEHLGYRFFLNDGFDPIVLTLAKKLNLKQDSILLDIGANIGSTSIPFGIRIGGEIIAIEASKKNAHLLVRNASLNRVKIRPHIVCAVDPETFAEKKWMTFYRASGNSAANSLFKSWNPSKIEPDAEHVPTSTVDTLLASVDLTKIAIVKIDVEGAEAMVLKGFGKLAQINAPVLFEYRVDVMKRDLGDDGHHIIELLSANHVIYGLEETPDDFRLSRFDPSKPYANAIAIPRRGQEYFCRALGVKPDEAHK
jgi:FkbM family methyltransferase